MAFWAISAAYGFRKVKVPTKEGQTVNAVQSAPSIVKLAILDTMTVKAQISEADVIKVHPGQSAYFTILGDPDHRYYATLRTVAPAPDSIAAVGGGADTTQATQQSASGAAVYYSGLFDVANPDGRLRPSMTAQVNFVLAGAKRVVVTSAAALGATARDGMSTVRVLDSKTKKPQTREVRVGINNNINIEVLNGLKTGEQVIVGEGGAVVPPNLRGSGG